MAFKFAAGETIETGLRRIVAEQAGKAALAARDGADDPQAAIHAVRRRCKKIRAALRLVRGSFPDYRRENEAVRDAARALGRLRDRPVVLQTYDTLVREENLTPDTAERDRLVQNLATSMSDDPVAALESFADEMDELVARSEDWKLKRDGFGALEEGLEKTYHRTRKALKVAERHPTTLHLHDWRKLAKYHGHHLGLVSPSAPHILLASRTAANDLADLLGRHHDLDMLAGSLPADASLAPAMARRKRELEAESFRLGGELTVEPPDAFAARCSAYWADWVAEKK